MIAIACDHAGLSLKTDLLTLSHPWLDLGVHATDRVDYPDIASDLAQTLLTTSISFGVLICGSGIGMSIAINRYPHIRAALCTSGLMARLARQHNDANVLVLGARLIGSLVAEECLEAFLTTPFEGGRHIQRVEKLSRSCP